MKKMEIVETHSKKSRSAKRAVKKEKKTGERKREREKKKVFLLSAKRKEAIARARIKEGKGIVRINGIKLDAIQNPYVKEIISEPLVLAGSYPDKCQIDVNVRGGGVIGQAQAARTAIARALVAFTKDEDLKRKFIDHDRFLLVDDVRRVEPKKYKGRKARARFQKSYR